jgi:hypothetical protein
MLLYLGFSVILIPLYHTPVTNVEICGCTEADVSVEENINSVRALTNNNFFI